MKDQTTPAGAGHVHASGTPLPGEAENQAVAAEISLDTYTGVVASTRKPSLNYQIGVVVGTVGNVIALYTPYAVGLSLKINEITSEADRVAALSIATGIGSFAALIANPLIGRLSDRTPWRIGRRRPWIIGGSLAGFLGLLLIALSTSLPTVLAGWCIAQIGFGGVMAATYATLADQVEPQHRGKVGGLIGIGVPTGMALGAVISSMFTEITWMIIVPAAIGAAMGVAFAVMLRDRPASKPENAFDVKQFLGSFVFDPRKYPDFGWVWLTKFLFMCAYTTGTAYTAYFLLQNLQLPVTSVAGVIAMSLVATGLGNFITSPLGGWLSDRFGMRRPFVALAAAVAMSGLIIVAFSGNVPMFVVGQFILGLGVGCFNAVDLALATDTLPDDGSAAKNLGVFNIASSLPQMLIAAIAAPIVMWVGYPGLFVTGAALGLLGAALVFRVKSVR